jgi:peptide/nickel transport system permease protein
VRYALQMYQLLSFNLGYSNTIVWNGSHNVGVIIAAYLPNTILLFASATTILVALGVVIGLLAARSLGGTLDRIVPFIAMLQSSLPSWWLAIILIAFLGYGVGLFPTKGMTSVPPPTNSLLYDLDIAHHMILPIITLLIVGLGAFAYIVRNLVVSTMEEDFVITARARGMTESKIVFKHVFRTASPAIATQAILAIVGSFAGAMLVEITFIWPGIGYLTYLAINNIDIPVIEGITFVLAFVLFSGLLVGELVYGLLDPRIRSGGT